MTATRYTFTRASGNRKTGAIPVTITTADTCPDSCALKNGGGCYAESGFVSWHWKKLNNGTRPGLDLESLARYIRTIPGGGIWRHNVAGDLPGENETIDRAALRRITRANRGRRGFTFTHKATTPENVEAIREANAAGFTVNLSANNAAEADQLAAHGLPVVVIIPADAPKVSTTPGGRKIVQCPAETRDRVTCATCALCQNSARPYLIGFAPKGARKRAVNQLAQGK